MKKTELIEKVSLLESAVKKEQAHISLLESISEQNFDGLTASRASNHDLRLKIADLEANISSIDAELSLSERKYMKDVSKLIDKM